MQVIANTVKWMTQVPGTGQQVFRAHFSSIAAPDIKTAMVRSDARFPQDKWRCRLGSAINKPLSARDLSQLSGIGFQTFDT